MARRGMRRPVGFWAACGRIAGARCRWPLPAGAQFFDDRYPGEPRQRRQQQQRQQFIPFPFFGDRRRQQRPALSIQPVPPADASTPVDSTRPPPPRKPDTPPTSTVVVIGDAMADWLGLRPRGSLRRYAGDRRRAQASGRIPGLIRYDAAQRDARMAAGACKDMLAAEKPSAIVVMLGLNDRQPIRERVAPPKPSPQAAPQPAQAGSRSRQTSAPTTPTPPRRRRASSRRAPPPSRSAGPRGDLRIPHRQMGRGLRQAHRRHDRGAQEQRRAGALGRPAGDPRPASDQRHEPISTISIARAPRRPASSTSTSGTASSTRTAASPCKGPDFEGQIRRLRSRRRRAFHQGRRASSSRTMSSARSAPRDVEPRRAGGAAGAGGAGGAGASPASRGARPGAPVRCVPLTRSTPAATTTNCSAAAAAPRRADADPTATRVLVRGEPIAAPPGRADDFAWPRRGDCDAVPDADTAAATPIAAGAGAGEAGDAKAAPPSRPTAKTSRRQRRRAAHARQPMRGARQRRSAPVGAGRPRQPTLSDSVRRAAARCAASALRCSRLSAAARRAHQELVDRVRGLAAFADRPDHQRLAAAHVAGGEDLVERGLVVVGVGLDVAARVEREPERLDHALVHRMHEAHRQQHEIGLDLELGAGDRLELVVDAHAVQLLHRAVLAGKFRASAPRNRARRLPRGSTRCAASAASPARSASCSRAPAAAA